MINVLYMIYSFFDAYVIVIVVCLCMYYMHNIYIT